MDKMKETLNIVTTLCVFLLGFYYLGYINIYSPFYEAADPSEPSAVTINGRSASLLSGSDNLSNAFANDYSKMVGCVVNGNTKLLDVTHGGFAAFYQGNDHCREYEFDPFGEYSDICSIYNGVTTASTKEELEIAFGTDCIKTDNYYAEIFVDNKEVDYESIDYPNDFDSYKLYEITKNNYPEAEYITILQCYYYSDDSQNNITFYIYDNNINIEEI
ncbi:MAG: hypothetical protein K2N71_03640 [Oscillospiraceae bacterium]|nr:hypothetical protein [Oscillospiraceae bacterium]